MAGLPNRLLHDGGEGVLLGIRHNIGDDQGGVGQGPPALAQEAQHVLGRGDLHVVEGVSSALIAVDAQCINIHGPAWVF